MSLDISGLSELYASRPELRALLFVVGGGVAASVASRVIKRAAHARVAPQATMIASRAAFLSVAGFGVFAAAHELGVDLGFLFGAAGLVTVALGFAAQTSASNLVSGLFLLGEASFAVGDIIRVETISGEVLSIDTLSVKVRTFDNLYVRIPNELIVKSAVTNLSRFPIRRLDIDLRVDQTADVAVIRDVVQGMVEEIHGALTHPAPDVWALEFGDASTLLRCAIWVRADGFARARAAAHERLHDAFRSGAIPSPTQRMELAREDEENAG